MLLVEGLHGWFFLLLQLFLFIRDIFLVILLTVCKVNEFEILQLGVWTPSIGIHTCTCKMNFENHFF